MSTQNPKIFLQLQKYDFELQYAPGKTMLVSDTSSRSYLNDIKPEFDGNTLTRHVHFILLNLPISQSRLEQFRLETQNDQILQTLICYTIMVGQKNMKYRMNYFLITSTAVKHVS